MVEHNSFVALKTRTVPFFNFVIQTYESNSMCIDLGKQVVTEYLKMADFSCDGRWRRLWKPPADRGKVGKEGRKAGITEFHTKSNHAFQKEEVWSKVSTGKVFRTYLHDDSNDKIRFFASCMARFYKVIIQTGSKSIWLTMKKYSSNIHKKEN